MAIQPIDMQTLFSQLEKVGKTQAFAQHGVEIKNAIEQEESTKRSQEKHQAVAGTTDAAEEGLSRVKDRQGSKDEESNGQKKHKNDQSEEIEVPPVQTVSDPKLGRHIDISG